MTRLERHQQRESRRRALILGVIVLAVVGFFLTVGVPLFVNLSGAAGKMISGESASEIENDDLEFNAIELLEMREATNSASLAVTGSVSGIDNVTVYLNGSVTEKLDVSGKSEFETTIDGLDAGTNEIYASGSKNGSKSPRETQKYTVTYRSGKPTIEISSPADNSSTPRDEIQVSGKTNTGSGYSVKVNGSPTVAGSDGTFKSSVKLKEGENKIVVNVTDNAGNSEEKTVTVKYEK